ncbi:TauD/TfdA family dioxygenase [Frankia sp. Cpl3]|uniref:TauD/TfdA dioxygenase family protein n=1 Tax=Parafrankia colletiae TaxID=573497 RepID=UPI000B0ABF1C|nr:TauD/TfdA family dioxygenase [Parafrankia colletiae]MCK9902648.1 TauD/TfdA family dioxygenase [Frankia sp. Cpl3]
MALEETGVVVFSEASIDDEDLIAFGRLLGNVLPLPMGGHKYKEIQRITRDASQSRLAAYREATFHWHIDGTTGEVPDKATLLTARQVTDDGEGDTEFANTYAAYEALPEAEKAELADLSALHSFAASQLVAIPNPSPFPTPHLRNGRSGTATRPGSSRSSGPAAVAASRCSSAPPRARSSTRLMHRASLAGEEAVA